MKMRFRFAIPSALFLFSLALRAADDGALIPLTSRHCEATLTVFGRFIRPHVIAQLKADDSWDDEESISTNIQENVDSDSDLTVALHTENGAIVGKNSTAILDAQARLFALLEDLQGQSSKERKAQKKGQAPTPTALQDDKFTGKQAPARALVLVGDQISEKGLMDLEQTLRMAHETYEDKHYAVSSPATTAARTKQDKHWLDHLPDQVGKVNIPKDKLKIFISELTGVWIGGNIFGLESWWSTDLAGYHVDLRHAFTVWATFKLMFGGALQKRGINVNAYNPLNLFFGHDDDDDDESSHPVATPSGAPAGTFISPYRDRALQAVAEAATTSTTKDFAYVGTSYFMPDRGQRLMTEAEQKLYDEGEETPPESVDPREEDTNRYLDLILFSRSKANGVGREPVLIIVDRPIE